MFLQNNKNLYDFLCKFYIADFEGDIDEQHKVAEIVRKAGSQDICDVESEYVCSGIITTINETLSSDENVHYELMKTSRTLQDGMMSYDTYRVYKKFEKRDSKEIEGLKLRYIVFND